MILARREIKSQEDEKGDSEEPAQCLAEQPHRLTLVTIEVPHHGPAEDEPTSEPGGGDEEEQHHHWRQHGIGLVGTEDLFDVEEEGSDQEHMASGQHRVRYGGF